MKVDPLQSTCSGGAAFLPLRSSFRDAALNKRSQGSVVQQERGKLPGWRSALTRSAMTGWPLPVKCVWWWGFLAFGKSFQWHSARYKGSRNPSWNKEAHQTYHLRTPCSEKVVKSLNTSTYSLKTWHWNRTKPTDCDVVTMYNVWHVQQCGPALYANWSN